MDKRFGKRRSAAKSAAHTDRITEARADLLIRKCGGASIGLYSEKQLARKIRDEDARLPVVREWDALPTLADHLFRRLAGRIVREFGLTRLESRVCRLLLDGNSPSDAAGILGMSRQRFARLLLRVRAAVEKRLRRDRYYGLHEVYWQEVNRYIYRKPRLHWR